MLQGVNIDYNKVAKVGFLIKNLEENPYTIYDAFNNNITTDSFNYFFQDNISYYISKEYVSFSTLHFKFIKN